jgi:hypothetical protein
LQPLPAAVRERLLDGHLRTPQRGNTISGETAVFEDVGSSGLKVLRRYCPRCGSPLTTEPDLTPDVMFVKAGGINSNEWFHPVLELFVGRRRPWVSPVTGATQFEGNPIL